MSDLVKTSTAIVDADPDSFAAALDVRQINRKELMQWIWQNLKENTDYGTIPGTSKPSLWQPGAEKIAGLLGLRPEFPDAEKYVDLAVSSTKIEQIVLRCYLVDSGGKVVGEGLGAREVTEIHGKYEWQDDPQTGKRKKVRVGEREVRDLNKALKMAEKSAMIDAIKRTGGLSEVFTQDRPDEDLDISPLADHPTDLAYLEKTAADLFGDDAGSVLQSLALRRYRVEGGDHTQIPVCYLAKAVQALKEKATGRV